MRRIKTGFIALFAGMFVLAVSSGDALAGESRGSSRNARDVVEMFVSACLENIDAPEKASDWASGRFPPLPADKAPSFINAVSPSGGKAWGKHYSRGSQVIVVGNDGSCSIFASLADTQTLISEIQRNLKNAASRLHGADVETYPQQPGQPELLRRFKLLRPGAPTDVLVNVIPQADPNYEAVIAAKAVGHMPETGNPKRRSGP